MCELCENKVEYATIEDGFLYMEDVNLPKATITFPVHFCPWCGKDLNVHAHDLPKITPRAWKYQMQEQEEENDINH